MGTTEELINFVMTTKYNDFPQEAVSVTKNLVLDCIGAMLYGSNEETGKIVTRYVQASGGVPEAGVIGGGFLTSLENAAFANGTLTHTAELEAVGERVVNPQHVIAAALSVAHRFRLSGKQLLEGIILGQEVQGRMHMGTPLTVWRGHCPLPLYGPPAVAALTAKMMGLNPMRARMAVGIAISHSGGMFRQMGGYTFHYVDSGIASRNGVTAALLAREGITGDPSLIEGKWGFCDVFCPGEYDLSIITKNLGNPYCIVSPGIAIKNHGCCFAQHVTIQVLLKLMADHNISYEQVESVQLNVASGVGLLLRPDLSRSTMPRNGHEARFSLHHAHAVALADRATPLAAFTDAAVAEPRYAQARKKINVTIRNDFPGNHGGSIELKLKDGRTFSGDRTSLTGNMTKGSPANPFTRDELVARHEMLASEVLTTEQIKRSIELVFNLEELPDVVELMELCTFGNRGANGNPTAKQKDFGRRSK